MKAKYIAVLMLSACYTAMTAQQASTEWVEVKTEMRPAARWWWMGSAVDKENLSRNLSEYAQAGMGTMEITPIYGVQGNDANEIGFLSPKWMDMLHHTENEATRLGMQIDMNTGTGWPFGGPEVEIEDAATKVIFQEYRLKAGEVLSEAIVVSDKKQQPYAVLSRLMAYPSDGTKKDLTNKVDKQGHLNWKAPKGEWKLIAAFCGKTLQRVKRAAPGGEGYVMDHLSKKAVSRYLDRFTRAFEANKVAYPHNFFNDSYEVYKADWTPDFFDEFQRRRGYKLENYLPEFLDSSRPDITRRIVSDYRETIAELLQENFTEQWTRWAHKHGSLTRNQAHGSPGNLIDLYATVDVPECEGFGMSDFGIKGLRKDSLTRPNDSELSMLKYASSAAHITGKPYTSSETFTWLTEHFRTSLSQCKPDLDLMFISGVNHVYFHGTTYSPADAAWPGWKFYASIDMSPTNTIWRDAPAFFDYITRCQSFLQMGKPDNDFLVYLPVYDMWYEQDGRLLMFDIHKMAKRAPHFIRTIQDICKSGYDVDYISDWFVRSTRCEEGRLQTVGGTRYRAIVVPEVKMMPEDVFAHLLDLARQGATVVFLGGYPESVPGYSRFEERNKRLQRHLAKLPPMVHTVDGIHTVAFGKGRIIVSDEYEKALAATGVMPEEMKTTAGLQCIRRMNETGHHYFVANLQGRDIDEWVRLSVPARSVVFFNPLNGERGKAEVRNEKGVACIRLSLRSGESIIVRTYKDEDVVAEPWHYAKPQPVSLSLDKGWNFHFVQSEPRITGKYVLDELGSWTEADIPDVRVNMGTGCYTIRFVLPEMNADDWLLSLGDVRESARVRVNGREVTTLWSVPYITSVGNYLRPGENLLEVEVTNLPANRIADYDRRNIPWRIFKEINMVGLSYKKAGYGDWLPVPSGLLGPVKLIPCNYR